MDYQRFAAKLLKQRQQLQLTQEELALRVGVTPQAISKWERGISLPDIELLYQLSKVLSLSMDELLDLPTSLTESDNDKDKERLFRAILSEPITLKVGCGFVDYLMKENQQGFPKLQQVRINMAKESGYLLPTVRILDDITLDNHCFQILFYDKVVYEQNNLNPSSSEYPEIFEQLNLTCTAHYEKLLHRQIVKDLIDNLSKLYPVLVDGYIPDKLSYAQIQFVLKSLIEHKKSIRNLCEIIEYLEDNLVLGKDLVSISNELIQLSY
ncbi:FHIPEP family type III secretion protein [Lachnoclostridium phytofermentans]|uniref:Transcriptional regulator, XRE family n=1 Tax=Lachnoclostridium phytofermentans (strain ATCC 700394 / DSM 18823 / ISDg) TaxID=357809 RepID=A9KQE5_LACP7|nr:FHIPEP family type III secretion protein [Lachnoclostridium phytofermentans]ABX40454.1 transcriptional regulator, XRE family [Lachnoclostridium phytofermentans ISDg]